MYKNRNSPEVKEKERNSYQIWKQKNPETYRRTVKNQNLKKSFGITLADYEKMEKEQNGLCAICQKPEKHTSRNPQSSNQILCLAVDHDHVNNRVRALLCMDCNKGLGCFGEDILRLQAAIEYIKKHSGDK